MLGGSVSKLTTIKVDTERKIAGITASITTPLNPSEAGTVTSIPKFFQIMVTKVPTSIDETPPGVVALFQKNDATKAGVMPARQKEIYRPMLTADTRGYPVRQPLSSIVERSFLVKRPVL